MMEPLIITGTDEIPTVILDKEKNLFEISGQSIPEEAISFYSPVIDWFEEYSQNPNSKTILRSLTVLIL
ncbi:MAG TPA: SiaC family regulatory phosphoprotein, partial [Bacteroidales bacterium]|nr:SiaC family regulatory phosphoprotein [Bacteroidales bacterium]